MPAIFPDCIMMDVLNCANTALDTASKAIVGFAQDPPSNHYIDANTAMADDAKYIHPRNRMSLAGRSLRQFWLSVGSCISIYGEVTIYRQCIWCAHVSI